ncbi:NAD(P)/FAD-dependent oxidoreductase, partial [Dyadobacter sp.]|uniref:NAD(P)/FAD-dependent oxidoreductase n=1 Tax=Dyadobacter sp. TaxID=1914288 RepID=UPI003F6F11D4
ERVDTVTRLDHGGFVVQTHDDTRIECKVLVIAGGLGCFEPRKPVINGLEQFEGQGISYFVKNPETFRNRTVVLSGGGDSALDWAIFLAPIASEITLVHRGETFRGAPDSAEKVVDMAHKGQIRLLLESQITEVAGNGHLQSLTVSSKHNGVFDLEADHLIPLFGLTPKLGPIADWGLALDKSAIEVNVDDYSTSTPGIFAIGDINTYTGKLKLILSGFHEAALMAQSAFKYVYPEQKLSFKYTTVNGVNAF